MGELPENAQVTAEQAESALGRTMTTEVDLDMLDAVDADTKEEEEALAGRQVNPPGHDYSCISWQPTAPDSVSAAVVGWEEGREVRALDRTDVECTAGNISKRFHVIWDGGRIQQQNS